MLDGLRAVSICLVLATHLLPLGPKYLELNAAAGAMGMSLFFALSGFLIVRTLQKTNVPTFLVRRLARLMPLAWLYLALVWLLHPLSLNGLWAGLLFHLNYRPELMVPQTEHLWSLAVEMHFYLGVALTALVHRRAIWLVWPLCLIITGLRVMEGAHLSIATHLRVDEILVGACLGLLPAAWLKPDRYHDQVFGFWLCAVAAWALTSHPQSGALQFVRPYATALLLAMTLCLGQGPVRRVLVSRLARYIASISYALYVIHPLTAHGWWNAGTLAERYLMKRPVSIAITFALAHLSTHFWEAFWINATRKWGMRLAARQKADAPAVNAPAHFESAPCEAASVLVAAAKPSTRRPAAP